MSSPWQAVLFPPAQDDLEAELLESPEEREPVGSSKNRKARDFGTCQVLEAPTPCAAEHDHFVFQTGAPKPQLDLL